MTRRERLERKLEKRAEWAQGRREKAADLQARAPEMRDALAFIVAAIERGFTSADRADSLTRARAALGPS
jgi:hypothetical protein